MLPTIKKPIDEPKRTMPAEDADFAEEAAPKQSEFDTEKDAKDITAGEFDRIP